MDRRPLVLFLSKIFSSVLSVVATIYFARVLGAGIYGSYAVAVALVAWFKIGVSFGVGPATTKRISEGNEPEQYFTAGLIISALLGGIVTLIIILFRGDINRYIGEDVAILVAVLTLVSIFNFYVRSVFNGQKRVHLSGLVSAGSQGLRLILQLAVLFMGLGLFELLAGYALGFLIVPLFGLYFMKFSFKTPSKRHFTSLVDFAKFAWLGNVESRSFNDIDILLLGALVSGPLVGIYSIAWSIVKSFNIFSSTIRTTLFPAISESDTKGNTDDIQSFVRESIVFVGVFPIPGIFGLIMIGDEILSIYGNEFTKGSTVLVLLAVSYLLYVYHKQFMNALNALDRPDLPFRINIAAISTNIILNFIFIQLFGWTGAAVATVISTCLGLILSYFSLHRLICINMPTVEITKQVISSIIMFLFLGFTDKYISIGSTDIVNVVILILSGAFVYIIVLFIISKHIRSVVLTTISSLNP